jgi:hypothetical protein
MEVYKMSIYNPPQTIISDRAPVSADGINYDLVAGDNWIDQTNGFWYIVMRVWSSKTAFIVAKMAIQ